MTRAMVTVGPKEAPTLVIMVMTLQNAKVHWIKVSKHHSIDILKLRSTDTDARIGIGRIRC